MRKDATRVALRVLFLCLAALPLPTAALAAPVSDAAAETIVQQALTKVAAGDLEGAIGDLEPLRELVEPPALGLATLGSLYLEIGLPQDALEVLAPLAASAKADPAVLYNAGRAALDLGDEAAAERYLERSVVRAPLSPAARLLGLRRGARGDMAAAYRLLGPWAAAHPDDREARLAAAVGALRLGHSDTAAQLLDGLAQGDPRVALLRAELFLQQQRAPAAVDLLEPLLDGHPPEMEEDLLVLLATAYLDLGRAADATRLLRPRAAGRQRLTALLERAAAAPAAPAAASDFDPLVARLAEASRLLTKGDGEAALTLVRQEISLAPRDLRPRLLEVRALLALGRHDEALASVEKALELAPDHPHALHFRAVVRMAQDALTAAESDLRRVLEVMPEHLPAMTDLAWVVAARGDDEEARALLERVLTIDPEHTRARLRLRQLEGERPTTDG